MEKEIEKSGKILKTDSRMEEERIRKEIGKYQRIINLFHNFMRFEDCERINRPWQRLSEIHLDYLKGFKDALRGEPLQFTATPYSYGLMHGQNARLRGLERIEKIKAEIPELRKERIELKKILRKK